MDEDVSATEEEWPLEIFGKNKYDPSTPVCMKLGTCWYTMKITLKMTCTHWLNYDKIKHLGARKLLILKGDAKRTSF